MLVLTRKARRHALTANNCLAFDLSNGQRIRVWFQAAGDRGEKLRILVDAPNSVAVRRGEHIGQDAEGPVLT